MLKLPLYRNWLARFRALAQPHDRSCAIWIDKIRQQSQRVRSASARELIKQVELLRERTIAGESLLSEEIVVATFGLTTEAVRRATGKTYYDVQLIGGLVLAAGAVAEIQTGEGKTLVTALPAVLHALQGKGVHVGTTNDYLSQRDFQQLHPVYELLGLSCGLIKSQASPDEKFEAYACDITYGPGYEFGFDYLRDQLSLRTQFVEPLGARVMHRLQGTQLARTRLTQRGHAFAIVDEADSVLIDEASTPLILSGASCSTATDASIYQFGHRVANELELGRDFEIDKVRGSVAITAIGWQAIQAAYLKRPAGRLARPWLRIVENALRALHLLHSQVDYVVQGNEVMIVDPNTGRIHDERRWRGGLHQAVEVKESLSPSPEMQTQARITRQRFSQFYQGMCGLTGTARGGEAEFRDFYGMPVVVVPSHRPCVRETWPARFFATRDQKLAALAKEVMQRRATGQPILLGTRTIQESHAAANALSRQKIPHTVLNGLQDMGEATIVAQAGAEGVVTVATNMAGRGTDIQLTPAARQAGGLHVIATEFHESSRVDRQLIGRAARQGDPGSCQFFASADDDLFTTHAPRLAKSLGRIDSADGSSSPAFADDVTQLQGRLERHCLAARRRIVAHDDWLNSIQDTLARGA